MIREPLKIFDAVSVGATVSSPAVNIGDGAVCTLIAVVSGGGSPVGVLALQGSHDNVTWVDIATAAVSADGAVRVSSATVGDYVVRATYTRTSGTGVISGHVFAKK